MHLRKEYKEAISTDLTGQLGSRAGETGIGVFLTFHSIVIHLLITVSSLTNLSQYRDFHLCVLPTVMYHGLFIAYMLACGHNVKRECTCVFLCSNLINIYFKL